LSRKADNNPFAASVLLNLNSANLIPQALALIVQRRQLPTCHARRARPHSTHTSKIGHQGIEDWKLNNRRDFSPEHQCSILNFQWPMFEWRTCELLH
jgi:hypothetical protein